MEIINLSDAKIIDYGNGELSIEIGESMIWIKNESDKILISPEPIIIQMSSIDCPLCDSGIAT